MTWAELAQRIQLLSDEQKQTNVTVQVGDEFLPMNSLADAKRTDVLDEGHPYLLLY